MTRVRRDSILCLLQLETSLSPLIRYTKSFKWMATILSSFTSFFSFFLFSFSLALSQFPKNPSTASSLVSPNLPPTFKCPPFSSPCLTRLFHLYLATQCGNTTFVHQYCTCFHSFNHFKFILMVNLFLFFLPNISVCIEGTMHIS